MVKKNRMAFFDADALSMYLKFFCYFYLKISDKAIVDKNK